MSPPVRMEIVRAELRKDEGYRDKPYLDTKNVWTIGWGHNLNFPMAREALELQFQIDVDEAFERAKRIFTLPTWRRLGQARQEAAINLVYNLGYRLQPGPGRKGFPKFLAACRAEDWPRAADELIDSDWYRRDVGKSRSEPIIFIFRHGQRAESMV